jgi:hypothetical protein
MTGKGAGDILIQDISLGGIGFLALAPRYFKEGDVLKLDFRLDNSQGTEISFSVTVKNIHDAFVGAEIDPRHNHQKDLGFYLLP